VVTEASHLIAPRSQHLCLSFNLADVRVYSDLTSIRSQLTTRISFVLNVFLIKYATELELSEPESYLENGGLEIKFAKVFVSILLFAPTESDVTKGSCESPWFHTLCWSG
jgi:hypothetical protein